MKEFIEKEALEILESEEDCCYKCEFCSIATRCQGMIHFSHCKNGSMQYVFRQGLKIL